MFTYLCGQKMFVLPIHFGIFLKNAEESKKPRTSQDMDGTLTLIFAKL